MPGTSIRGLGLAVPEHRFTQVEAARVAEVLGQAVEIPTERVGVWYQRVGVTTRRTVLGRDFLDDVLNGTRTSGSPYLPHPERPTGPSTATRMALYAEQAGPLACDAAQRALGNAECPAEAITHLVTVSCTGFALPGVEFHLIRQLGLSSDVQRVHIGFMGCHAAINALRVVRGLIAADTAAVVLLVAVELCTLHHAYRPTTDELVANALFADGAAALVLDAGLSKPVADRVLSTASQLLPASRDDMSWQIGDHGFAMTLSRHVSRLIREHVRQFVEAALGRHQLTLGDVQRWAIHPGGPKILEAVAEGLSLPAEDLSASWDVLNEYGNMSSATVLFVWERLCRNKTGPGVMLAFGPGLTAELAILDG